MRKIAALLICMLLLSGCAAAEQSVALPESRYVISVPDDMKYSEPDEKDEGVYAYISNALEMDYRSYPVAEAAAFGLQPTLQESAEGLAANGADVELREVNGIETYTFGTAPNCVGFE